MFPSPNVSLDRLQTHLKHLARQRDPFLHTEGYFYARHYLQQTLDSLGQVQVQPFSSPFGDQVNFICHQKGTEPQRSPLIMAAHYDAVPGSPGADDNATGLAALLEIAHVLQPYPTRRTRIFIAFDLEEYGLLGSQAYVKQLRAQGQRVKLMLSLEMLGYQNSQPGSQGYPPGLGAFYPTAGNFIALVGNLSAIPAMGTLARALRQAGAPCQWLPVPLRGFPLPITRRSDHAAFWDLGASAIMVTDTADLRNPHYHQPSDRIQTLDLGFFRSVTQGLAMGLLTLAAPLG
ncbi:M28 family peptidase [Lyngbya confervoides]|uniref:M28 family peptidase n=1 Tax=Lyngbya confervoides BDU141951 TaxID=1574623 RepID=A0ABD4T2I9_9CYAN|nr:M28 family peptidase [Lyngbya confervoides]MCM1982814.1 M28 family peptidase [Lyngbya confervoides BDU141951]